jgi:thymidylate kinase
MNSSMIIVFEGVDGVGKSSIAKKLSEKLGFPVIKGSSFEQAKCTRDELFNKFYDMLFDYDDLILDRYIHSNVVYAPLYEDFAMISKGELRFLESQLELYDAIVIYLKADPEIIKQRLQKRGDEYISADKIEEISQRYDEIFGETNLKHYVIDTGKYSVDEIVEMILELVKQ